MLVLALGIVLTTALVTALAHRAVLNPADLGSMSTNWLAAHQAAQHASSM